MKLSFKKEMLALLGAFSVSVASTGSAAVVADGTPFDPGVPLTGTANFGGTVVADATVAFAETITPNFTGSLRSVVVASGGGTYDFYYQIQDVASLPTFADIFRLTIDGFDPFATGVMDYVTNGLTGITGAGAFAMGNKFPLTADRDPSIGTGVGFGFATTPGMPLFDPNNLDNGDTSFWMVVRTNATAFTTAEAVVSGFGSAITTAYAPSAVTPVPEPGSALVGLAVMGVCFSGMLRRNRTAAQV